MPKPRFIVPLLVVLGLGPCSPVGADEPSPAAPVDPAREAERYVIPPGVEPLFSEMLGSGQTLPGECKLGDGRIERTAVLATYDCAGGQVVLELVHPDAAPGGVQTRKFAATVRSGSAPQGFVDAVADRIRAREGAFEWTQVGPPAGIGGGRLVRVAAGVGAALLLLLLLLRRFRSRSAAGTPR